MDEQEIRARALEAAMRLPGPMGMNLIDTFEEYIKTGKKVMPEQAKKPNLPKAE